MCLISVCFYSWSTVKVSEDIVSPRSPVIAASLFFLLFFTLVSLISVHTCFCLSIGWEKHTTIHITSWLITIWLCDSMHPVRADPAYLSPFSSCFLSHHLSRIKSETSWPYVTLQDHHTSKACSLKALWYTSLWWICTKQPWGCETPERGGIKFSVRLRAVCPLKARVSNPIHKVPLWVKVFFPINQKPHLSLLKAKGQLITQGGSGVAPARLDREPACTPSLLWIRLDALS